MRIFTWHVHGSYLYSLVQARNHEFFIPVTRSGQPPRHGYGGRAGAFPWPDNVHEIDIEDVKDASFDVVLTQSRDNWLVDRHEILSAAQRELPRIHIEHDPPRESPTDTAHFIDDENVLLVHVTHFNALMWNSGRTPTRVIEHGVAVPPSLRYQGDIGRGLVVVNGLAHRGRRLGVDVFEAARQRVPLDLAGMESEKLGGLGDVPLMQLWERATHYRFLFNPIRWTSMGMAVCEAMMLGLPIVGLSTTEMPDVIQNGVSGYLSNDMDTLVEHMQRLLSDADEARRLGEGARAVALARYGIPRFVADWDRAFRQVTQRRSPPTVTESDRLGAERQGAIGA